MEVWTLAAEKAFGKQIHRDVLIVFEQSTESLTAVAFTAPRSSATNPKTCSTEVLLPVSELWILMDPGLASKSLRSSRRVRAISKLRGPEVVPTVFVPAHELKAHGPSDSLRQDGRCLRRVVVQAT
jgi:hypothetical protein